jgi:hypothetical protein
VDHDLVLEVELNSAIDQSRAGLCADCAHARRMTSDKGSVFIQCRLAATDGRFAKYPRLPVLTCTGYSKVESKAAGEP